VGGPLPSPATVAAEWDAFHDAAIQQAARAARSLDLRLDYLDATLLTITAAGGAFAACCHGDGVVALGRQDGWIEVYAVSYAASSPVYPSYRLDAPRRDQWETQSSNEKRVTCWIENAPQLFEGVTLQSLLGAWYASLSTGPGRCHQVRLAELDGAQVLDAKLQGGVLMVIAARVGRYEKLIFSMAGMKVIADPALGVDCLLLCDGPQALMARGGALSGFAMR